MNFPRAHRRRPRHDGWTESRIVTFVLALAATCTVTFAAAAAGLSRKSAYALRARDPGFAALWNEALAGAEAARLAARPHRRPDRRPDRRKGDKTDKTDTPPESFFHEGKGDKPDKSDTRPDLNIRRDRCDAARREAESERDRFFSSLELRLPAAFRGQRFGRPLANGRKPSNGDRFAKRA